MEDSFRVRVDRVFGSLTSTSSSSSSPQPTISSLWSLTDDEIRKDTWTREPAPLSDAGNPAFGNDSDDEGWTFPSPVDRLLSSLSNGGDEKQTPNPNSGVGDLMKDLQDDLEELDDDNDEGKGLAGEGSSKGDVVEDEEEFDVRKSIGMDSTLDFEEEEDAYDKVAVGREKTGDRLYLSDVNDYMPDFYSCDGILNTFKEASRDPRANHLGAELRLQEDAEAARSFNSLHVSKEAKVVVSDTPNSISENGNNVKSILKRKEDQMGWRSEKRVRFEPSCKASGESEGDKTIISGVFYGDITLHKESSSKHRDSSRVPDYMRNPSRYTHYTFDSGTDMNEESNRQAYTEFISMLKRPKSSEPEEVPADISKPVIFNPKKRTGQGLMSMIRNETDVAKEISMERPMNRKSLPVSFASGGMPEDEARDMEVDEQVTEPKKMVKGGGERTARHYRSRQSLGSDKGDC
ncbi:hypothetical protein DM860_013826 [Cuscuta australis]|uniref:U5 small nuclear ribonucleoprotein TSSC4 n=1 Tax=Cuscuta australis TaxID=267555 RepID=A0A328DJJ9_9ASTE|nr:hypothetical protein DM860_013826 [Cuscuta australis]